VTSKETVATPQWLTETLRWTERVARESGALLRNSIDKVETRSLKRKRELVTEADRQSEDLILGHLRSRFPDHSIMTEETGGHETDSPFLWWIDPLDGTNSFAHGYPHFSVSMALEEMGRGIILGVVYDPMKDECFSAAHGSATTLNGREIHVSEIEALADSLAATGFPYDREIDNENNLREFNAMIMAIQGIRRGGSAALDLSYVAAGRVDAYWEFKLNPWDVAAGGLIVKQAGGLVTNIRSEGWDHRVHHIAASNGLLHQELLRVLHQARRDDYSG
jgi:myo-inositol-1(or 4)-monophosphatase